MKQMTIYWKQRGTIGWVKFGDEGSTSFYGNATVRSTKNLITSLKDTNDQKISEHIRKANLLLEAYKDRLGKPEFQYMTIDLQELLQASNAYHCLEEPFTNEDIDTAVKNFPTDKSPCPEGFNSDFIKKCWPIIAQDIYDLCEAFQQGHA